MERLNGWQRLWAAGCALAAILLVVAGSEIETEKQLKDTWEQMKNTRSREIAQQEIVKWKDIRPGPVLDELYRQSQQRIENEKVRMDELRDEALLDLPARQGEQARRLIYVWFAWAAATYVIGWAIGWIYRGFRPKAV